MQLITVLIRCESDNHLSTLLCCVGAVSVYSAVLLNTVLMPFWLKWNKLNTNYSIFETKPCICWAILDYKQPLEDKSLHFIVTIWLKKLHFSYFSNLKIQFEQPSHIHVELFKWKNDNWKWETWTLLFAYWMNYHVHTVTLWRELLKGD